MNDDDPREFQSRHELAERISTAITREIPAEDDPYRPVRTLMHGYDLYEDVLPNMGYGEAMLLMMTGRPPRPDESRRFELMMTAAMNPGPRDPAVRAAMGGGVGGTTVGNSLIAGLAVLQGSLSGGLAVEECARLLTDGLVMERNRKHCSTRTLGERIQVQYPQWPGFGLVGSGPDVRAPALLGQARFALGKDGPHAGLALKLATWVEDHQGLYLNLAGAFAAVAMDLELSPEIASGLFLLAGGAGALAHAVEQRNKPWHKFPIYWKPECYRYEGPLPGNGASHPSAEEEGS